MSSILHYEASATSNDNLKLFIQGWYSENNKKAIICLIHGIGEHSGRYKNWAERFVDEGVVFAILDLRGHGKSEGKRGHTPSLKHYLNDVEIFIKETKSQFPNLPVVLYGHSMGGNIGLNFIMNRPNIVDASIISSPWIKLTKAPSLILITISKLLKNIIPDLLQNNGLDTSFLSHDKIEVKKYIDDILIHNKISIATFVELHNSKNWILENPDKLQTQTIFIHGGGDKITSHFATMELANETAEISTIKIFDGLFHETHNEIEKEDVFKHLISELDKLNLYPNEKL